MSQAGRTWYFARSARQGEEKIFFSSPRLALRARVSLLAKHRARPARLIKRLSCRLMILRLLEHFGQVICSTFKVSCLFWVETGFKKPQISICKDFGGVLNYRKYPAMFVTQFNYNNNKIINWQLFPVLMCCAGPTNTHVEWYSNKICSTLWRWSRKPYIGCTTSRRE